MPNYCIQCKCTSLLLRNSQGRPLSPLAVQWHIVAAEKLSTAQGRPLSPLAVQLLRNSQLLKVGRSLLRLFSGKLLFMADSITIKISVSIARRRCSVILICWRRASLACDECALCPSLCVGIRTSHRQSLTGDAFDPVLSPSLADGHVLPQSQKLDALAVELCALPTAPPGPLHFAPFSIPHWPTVACFRSLRSTTLSLSSSVPCQPLLPGLCTFRRATLAHSSFRIHDGQRAVA